MKRSGHFLSGVACPVLLCLVAAAMLASLVTGARAYRSVGRELEEQYGSRTALAYVAAKARRFSVVSAESFGGASAVVLREKIDGQEYVTYIYWLEGYLTELFCQSGLGLGPEAGQQILKTEPFSAAGKEPGLVYCSCGTEGIFIPGGGS